MLANTRRLLTLGLSAVLVSTAARAAEIELIVTGGIGINDNILRTEGNESDETVALAGAAFTLSQNSSRIIADVSANAEYRSYLDNSVSNETLATFNGNAEFKIVPRVLSWLVSDNYGRALQDVFSTDNPENRENVNRFSTGPTLQFRINDVFSIGAQAEYANLSFEETEADVDQLSGSVSLTRALSANRSVGFSLTTATVEFDVAADSEFDRDSAFFFLNSRTGKSTLDLNLGFNQVDDVRGDRDGFFARLSLGRQLTQRTSISVQYRNEIGNSSDLFQLLQSGSRDLNDSRDLTGVDNPLDLESLSISLNYVAGRTTLYVDGALAKEDFGSGEVLNRDRYSLGFGASRELGSGWSLSGSANYQNSDFASAGRENEDTRIRLGLGKKLSRKLDANASFEHLERDTNIIGGKSEENVLRVTLSYRAF